MRKGRVKKDSSFSQFYYKIVTYMVILTQESVNIKHEKHVNEKPFRLLIKEKSIKKLIKIPM